jgi:HPt (histidine-containing phosphotransfer) domain-containing protein
MTLFELQQRFLAGLQRRLSEVTSLLDGAADPEGAMRMFHSLAGIAGTYGYHVVTDLSRGCENLCVSVIEEKRTFSPPELDRLKHAVVKISESVAATSS